MVLRRDDVEAVLRDGQRYSNAIHHELIGEVMGETMLGMDGQEHREHRDLVAKAFRASALRAMGRPSSSSRRSTRCSTASRPGRADLVADVTSRYPVQVIAGIVGVPVDDYERFQRWADGITSIALDPDGARPPRRRWPSTCSASWTTGAPEPRDDLVSDLVTAEIDGTRLTDDRILAFLRLLLPAGAETTFRAMGNALVALLTHPDVLARVQRRSDASSRR